jgi:hypothetical protein
MLDLLNQILLKTKMAAPLFVNKEKLQEEDGFLFKQITPHLRGVIFYLTLGL